MVASELISKSRVQTKHGRIVTLYFKSSSSNQINNKWTTWSYLAKFETLWRCWTAVDTRREIKIFKPVFSASVIIFAGVKPVIAVLGTYGNPIHSTFFDMPFDKVGFTTPETFFVFYVPFTGLYEKTNVISIWEIKWWRVKLGNNFICLRNFAPNVAMTILSIFRICEIKIKFRAKIKELFVTHDIITILFQTFRTVLRYSVASEHARPKRGWATAWRLHSNLYNFG